MLPRGFRGLGLRDDGMATAAEIQLIRNANPGAVLPGIDTPTGNPLPSSSLLNYTKITQNAKGSPYYYNPATLMFAVSSSRHKNALLARERFRMAATEQGRRHDHQNDG